LRTRDGHQRLRNIKHQAQARYSNTKFLEINTAVTCIEEYHKGCNKNEREGCNKNLHKLQNFIDNEEIITRQQLQ